MPDWGWVLIVVGNVAYVIEWADAQRFRDVYGPPPSERFFNWLFNL